MSETTAETIITLPGLKLPGSINIDRWGVPHIRAGNERDLFFLQGLNAARDRLWQIDLWRKKGLGLLAADFGPGYLEQDRASRLFLYRGDMAAEWAAYGPDAQMICTAFAEGVNAWIDHLEASGTPLPPEFGMMDTRPAKWAPEDVVRIRTHGWMRNVTSEVIRANILRSASAEVDLLRQQLSPQITPEVPEGLDLADLPFEVLDVYKLALAPVSFEPERLAAKPDEAHLWTKFVATGDIVRRQNGEGSNNWVIAPHRTDTGRPILGSDPHRAHAVPSLRYVVHLTCPTLDAIGAGEASSPGICIGHNGTAAVGLTLFFGPDQEDLYVYETHPDDPTLYRYGEGWERMTTVEEGFAVKGAGERTLAMRFTRHGPVIWEDKAKHRAIAVRTVWTTPGAAAYLRSLTTMRAQSFAEYREKVAGWAVPAVNLVYADTHGDIGWTVGGFSPVRPNWDGLLPVPGDGRYEWDGFFPTDRLPMVLNPAAGHFATANEMNLPEGWVNDGAARLGHEWLEPSRAERIAEVLGSTALQTLASSQALQCDVLSIPARRTCAVFLASPQASDPALATAAGLFREWDHRLTVDSAAAALFEVWWTRFLRPALIEAAVEDAALRPYFLPGDPAGVLALIEAPDTRLGPDPANACSRILADSLHAALTECRRLLGESPTEWAWGKLHRSNFVHATNRVAGGSPMPAIAPLPVPGSDSTPMNNLYRPSDFAVTLGASVRLVLDVGAWDNSRFVNAPGQSGNPDSPHYADLVTAWAQGDYYPLVYSAEAVDRETVTTLAFAPA